jgi:ribosomal protein S18 acetylase RimI-like enzyme
MLITFQKNIADQSQILAHLMECDSDFSPMLSSRVDLVEYSTKLYKFAENFEAWAQGNLVGMVAAYSNDVNKTRAYISNVSVISDFTGVGIANKLMLKCIQYISDLKFRFIELETSSMNERALNLYRKLGFEQLECSTETTKLYLDLCVKAKQE